MYSIVKVDYFVSVFRENGLFEGYSKPYVANNLNDCKAKQFTLSIPTKIVKTETGDEQDIILKALKGIYEE